jgi:serine/threonine protein kinase
MAVAFDFLKRLGSGYFGEVWHAVDTGLKCEVALKCIPPNKVLNEKNFFQEAQTLKSAEHPNVIRVNDTGTLDDGRIYVSMEYLSKGSIEDEASGAPLPLSRALRLMIDVLRGLSHAHAQKIIHRDIKPANILIGKNDEGILSDFGLALPKVATVDLSYIKKYEYILHLAPEVRTIKDYTIAADIYACGVTIYRLINGDSILTRHPIDRLPDLTRAGLFPPRDKYRYFIPLGLKRIINKAINVDPKKRFTSADEMRHALEHLDFHIDWTERITSNSIVWDGKHDNGLYFEVILQRLGPDFFNISVHKGKERTNLRRITKYSNSGISKKDALRQCREILQRLVTANP